jgi:hypothetical protein
MSKFLHAAYRMTDPAKSREFYETLGMEMRREVRYVLAGVRATSYFSPTQARSQRCSN